MKRKIATICAFTLLAGAGMARAQVVIGLDDAAQVVREYEPATQTFADLTTPGLGIRALAADDANRRFYFSTGSSLYRMSYDPPNTPELVGTFSGAVTAISGGLGFVPAEGLLYACTTSNSNLISVDPATAVTTLVRDLGGGDWGGLDFNSADNKLYLTNDSTSTANGLTGRGVYTIEPPYVSGTFVELVDYPGSETDLDGLAVGGGKVFLSRDLDNNLLYEYDLTTGLYTGPITRPGGSTTSEVFCGATYAPGLAVLPPGANISVAISGDAPCAVAVNGTATFNVTVSNFGPDPATGTTLEIQLPANADMVSSSPMGTLMGSTLSYNLGTLNASASQPITVTLRPTAGPSVALAATVMTTASDPVTGNNTATRTTTLLPTPPANAAIKGIISTVATSDSSLVLGGGGARFATGITAGLPTPSPDRRYWLQVWDTDQATTNDQVIVRSDNGTLSVVVQEGITVLPSGATPEGSFDVQLDINNAGQFVFSGGDNGPTASDGFVTKWDGTQFVDVAREGSLPPAATGGTAWGTVNGGAQIAANGSVSFVHSVAGLATTADTFVFKDDGNTIIAQEGITIPTGQAFNATFTYKAFDSTGPATGLFMNSDHSRYIIAGTVNDATTMDRVAVVDGDVKVQENVVLPGSSFLSPADTPTPIGLARMESNGDWLIYGSNDDGQDWVVRNGAVIARTGGAIHTGSAELFSDAPFSTTFFLAFGNASGDYVIGGTTDAADGLANAVIVFNGTTVIARENDPVDLDNNGMFDDNVYLRTFIDDRAFMSEDALFMTVRLRDANAAFCGGTDSDIGQALVRIPLPATVCIADFNNDGNVSVQDLFDFLGAYFANLPSADVNGVGGVSIQDIFDYLASFFAGCP